MSIKRVFQTGLAPRIDVSFLEVLNFENAEKV